MQVTWRTWSQLVAGLQQHGVEAFNTVKIIVLLKDVNA